MLWHWLHAVLALVELDKWSDIGLNEVERDSNRVEGKWIEINSNRFGGRIMHQSTCEKSKWFGFDSVASPLIKLRASEELYTELISQIDFRLEGMGHHRLPPRFDFRPLRLRDWTWIVRLRNMEQEILQHAFDFLHYNFDILVQPFNNTQQLQ